LLDHEAILSRLDRLAQYGRILRRLQMVPPDEFVSQVEHYGLAERYLQLSAECVFDVGQMVISGMGFRKPGEYREIIQVLVEEKALSPELGRRLDGLAGFRNILVHAYMDIDEEKVYQNLQENLADFGDYAREIVAFLSRGASTPSERGV
jgi:uncharacterized protein YutE (UPF0331/DUF86 family)